MRYLQSETQRLVDEGVRVTVVGRRDRLRPRTRGLIERTEEATRGGTRMRLRVAIDYSARETIVRAAKLAEGRDVTHEEFAELMACAMHCEPDYPAIDLLIRTSGEMRLSDFFLWESAYAELYFTIRCGPTSKPRISRLPSTSTRGANAASAKRIARVWSPYAEARPMGVSS